MRKWYKYVLNSTKQSEKVLPLDNSPLEHITSLRGNKLMNAYENKETFYKTFYFKYHLGRLEDYDAYLRKHLKKEDSVLSIACGRSANEMRLVDDGYDIFCTDLYEYPWNNDTKKLWPDYRFAILDILKNPSEQQYDAVIGLSVIFIFDESQLSDFFKNIYKSLNDQGYLIIDSAGSPDNLGSFFIHDILVKTETYLIRLIWFITSLGKKKFSIIKKHHGYRRTNDEIINAAEKSGFILADLENYAFLTEFSRSYILSYLMKIPFTKSIFRLLGNKIPYTRMFLFKKK